MVERQVSLELNSLLFSKEFREMRTFLALSVLASAVLATSVNAADVKSGLDVGEFPKAYYVTDVTGPAAGSGKLCYRCKYGSQPVVNIFARKMDKNLAQLIKEIDQVVAKNKEDHRMAAFVVMLTDEPDAAEGSLKKVATDSGILHTPLTVFDNSVGPNNYKISADADVTVMMWVDSEVKVNHAMKLTDLNADSIKKIAGDTAKILN